jgi:cell wall assembly regulator SMI1
MTDETWEGLEQLFRAFPILKAEPVPMSEIEAASSELQCPFPQDYRDFLRRYGGAVVGPVPIFGLRRLESIAANQWSVVTMTQFVRSQNWPGVAKWLIISMDLAGNPIGIAADGTVWIADHDGGDPRPIAEDFEMFVKECLHVSQ